MCALALISCSARFREKAGDPTAFASNTFQVAGVSGPDVVVA
jgi:hypothetical protein